MSLYLYLKSRVSTVSKSTTLDSPVHSRELTNVGKHVLQTIRKLECINVTKSELDMSVDHKLGQSENLSTKMEGVSES